MILLPRAFLRRALTPPLQSTFARNAQVPPAGIVTFRWNTQRVKRQVRCSALRALAKIDTLEAAEMLLGVLQHDGPEERAAAIDALKRSRVMRFVALARDQMKQLAGPAKAAVRDVLQARGISVAG